MKSKRFNYSSDANMLGLVLFSILTFLLLVFALLVNFSINYFTFVSFIVTWFLFRSTRKKKMAFELTKNGIKFKEEEILWRYIDRIEFPPLEIAGNGHPYGHPIEFNIYKDSSRMKWFGGELNEPNDRVIKAFQEYCTNDAITFDINP